MSKKAKQKAAAAGGDPSVTVQDAEVDVPNMPELDEADVAARAYSYWESRGCQGGSPEEDWQRAIDELKAERCGV